MLQQNKQELAAQIAKKTRWVKRNYRTSPGSLWTKRIHFRIGRPLLRFYYSAFKWFYPQTPWTSPASIVFFEKALDKGMTGFEFGSGLSTLFFSKKLKEVVSVEHDASWYNQIQKRLRESGISNVTYLLKEPGIQEGEIEEDVHIEDRSIHHGFSAAFLGYTSVIKQYPDNHFDFVLVDGRARVDCLLRSIPKLKPGGILVLDNSERERYKMAFEILAGWRRVNTTTGLTDTTIWFKPGTPG